MITLLEMTYKDYRQMEMGWHDDYEQIMGLRWADSKKYKDCLDAFNLQFKDIPCPKCKAKHQMETFGFYNRNVTTLRSVESYTLSERAEVIRLQCQSCLSTHALLPVDIIPYNRTLIDALLISVYEAFENPGVQTSTKHPKMLPVNQAQQTKPSTPCLNNTASPSSASVGATIASPWDFVVRDHFCFHGPILLGDGQPVPPVSMSRLADRDIGLTCVSELYFFRDKLQEAAPYLEMLFRALSFWNKGARPTLGELIRIMFEHKLSEIQKGMFRLFGMPLLFPLSRRTRTGFPYTGYAY